MRYLALLALTCLLGACGAAATSPLTRALTHAELLTLPPQAGTFAPPPPRLDIPLPETGWTPVTLPHSLPRDVAPLEDGPSVHTTWYRFALDAAQQQAHTPLFLYLPRWQTVGQVALYGDGSLLWRSRGDPVWNGFNRPVWVPLDPLDGGPRPATLLLRMDSTPGFGGGITRVWVGSEEDLIWSYRARLVLQNLLPPAIAVVYLVLALFGLSLWRPGRSEWLAPLFFIASLLYLVRVLHFTGPLDTRLVSSAWFGWLTVNSVGWLVVVSLVFNFWLCRRRYRLMERLMLLGMLCATLATLPGLASSTTTAALANLSYGLVLLMTAIAIPLLLWTAVRGRDRLALALACLNIAGVPLAVHDILLMNYQLSLERLYLHIYSVGAFFLLLWYILNRRFQEGFRAMEQGQLLLTRTLAAREAELAESYRQLREIERRDVLTGERQRLMQDMHDGLGASLTGALRMIEHGQCNNDHLGEVLRECIEALKLTIDSLEPVEADLGLLLGTLRFRMQPRLEAAGLSVRWHIEALPPLAWLTPGSALHVLRVVQEAITNVIKHAQADTLWLSASANADSVQVQISDNGIGLPAQPVSSGRGLTNMRHRAAALGAQAAWTARPEGGTRFTLTLPAHSVAQVPA